MTSSLVGSTPARTPHRPGWSRVAAAAIVIVTLACAPSAGSVSGAGNPEPTQATVSPLRIEHLTPRRDSTGDTPARFEWTPVDGADRYAIGLWSEVDRLMWRQDDIRTNSIAMPTEVQLESGTYFWSIAALNGDTLLVDSGLSAFVILR